jgi:hypothetical protein
LTFATSGLSIQTYHGELMASGGSATTGLYFFTFTVFSSTGTAPTISPPADQSAQEGVPTSFSLGSFTDPNDGPWTVDVNWDDRSTHTTFMVPSAGLLPNQTHTYAEAGQYFPTIKVTDSTSGTPLSDETDFSISVADAPLRVTPDPAFTAFKATKATVVLATFTDANPGDHTADFSTAITWGDGTPVDTSTGIVSYDSGTGVYTVTGSHAYAADGTYFASVRITDVGGFAVDTGVGLNDMGAVVTVPTQTPTAGAWYIDRYPPNGFVGGQTDFGRSGVIDQFISAADANGSRPSGFNTPFYDFQGHQYNLPPGTTYVTMDLYVPSAWSSLIQTDPAKTSNDGSLASLWGTAVDGSNVGTGFFPIIGFNNQGTNNGQSGGTAGFQVFDSTNGWTNVPGFTGYDKWYQLSYALVGGKFVYYVNGSPVYTDATPALATSVSVSTEILQGYNGGNSYHIFWNPVQDSQATVTDAPPSLRVVAGPAFSATEANLTGPVTLATFTDANPGDHSADFSTAINWGDGTSLDTTTGSVSYDSGTGIYTVAGSHLYVEEGTYFASVRITDVDGFAVDTSVGLNGSGVVVTAATQTAGAWYIDRYPPNGFIGGQTNAGRSGVIDEFISAADANGSRPPAFNSPFYDTQGRKYDLPPGTTYVTMDLYVPSVWAGLNQMDPARPVNFGSLASLWGTAVDASGAMVDFPIIGFNNLGTNNGQSGTAGFQVFDSTNSWTNVPGFTGYNRWYQLSFALVGGKFVYYVDGLPVYTDANPALATAVSVSQVFLQGYNGGNNYHILWNPVQNTQATVKDATLTATATAVSATEGVAFTGKQVASFTDANPTAPVGDFTASINWGDGTSSPGTVTQPGAVGTTFLVTGDHTYAEEGSHTITVSIADVGGSIATAVPTATVADAALNATGTPVSATEGNKFSGQVASFTDGNPAAPVSDFTISIDWGDSTPATVGTVTQPGGTGGAFVVSGSHTYAEDGSHTITVSITDKGGKTAAATPMATVSDAALTATGTPVSAAEGVNFSGQVASFTDANPKAPVSDFTASIDWGDGTGTTTGTVTQPGGVGTAFVVKGSHTYAEESAISRMITVNITDVGGSTAMTTSNATVSDAILTATGGFIVRSTTIGSHTVATFTDANLAAPVSDFSTTIDWGDGTPVTPGIVSQPGGVGTAFMVLGSHAYTATGTYSFPITVKITDLGGSTAMATSTASASFLVQGFVSGMTSPATSTFTVTAFDVNGNKATGYTGTVKFTSSSSPKADLPANYTFTTGDAGVHMFSATLRLAGSQYIAATDTVTSTFTGLQSGIIVNPGPANHLIVARFPSNPTAGVQGTFRVTIQDLYGNTVNMAPFFTDMVHFTSSDPQAVLPADYTFTAMDAGSHDFLATLKTAGNQTITVTDVTNPTTILPGTQPNIMVHAAAMSKLGVSGFPPFVTAGASHSVTVTAQDAFGNTITGYRGTVHFTSTDGAAMLPADYTFLSSDNGSHSFMVTLNTSGSQSITATDTSPNAFTGTQSGIMVQTIQPMVTVSGPSIGVPGQPLTFTFSASESGPSTFTYSIDWGDGSAKQSLPGGDGSPVMTSHTYTVPGTFIVSATAQDTAGNVSHPASPTSPVSITVVAMETDPADSTKTALFVGGTTGNDNIAISPSVSMSNGVKVGANSVNYGEFFPTGHVIVYGQTGADIIKTAPVTISGVLTYVNVPVIIFSGNGNNTLNVSGSIAGNVVVGGGGSNKLIGGLGRDILIAGAGPSTLQAGNPPSMPPGQGGAILIGGTTDFDNNAAALASILAEWSRTDIDYSMRIAHLMGPTGGLNGSNFLNATTVHDNHMVDTLTGGSGMDWFFAGMTDVLKNQATGETVTPIM